MNKYIVRGVVTVSCWTKVEAGSIEEAIELASERQLSELCYRPFVGDVEDEFFIDCDGEPFDLSVSYDDYNSI